MNEHRGTENTEGATGKLDKEQRIAAYREKLRELKERRVTLKEVMEREMLLDFIRANRGNINEFPLLDAQQNSVIDLMCQRSDHPAYEYVHRLTGNFLVTLNRYEKTLTSKDDDAKDRMRAQLGNAETLLIKCIQGIVYSTGLITDNFEELVLRNFGEMSLNDYGNLLEKHELVKTFWRLFLEKFVVGNVDGAHREMLETKHYILSKEGRLLIIRFPMDGVMDELDEGKQIDKTRIQQAFEANTAGQEGLVTLKVVTSSLTKGFNFLPHGTLSKSEMDNIARVVCIDDVSQELRDMYLNRVRKSRAGEPEKDHEKLNFAFLLEQVVASGAGALIGNRVMDENFMAAVNVALPEVSAGIQRIISDFRLETLQLVLEQLLVAYYLQSLRETGREEGGKIVCRSLQMRRAPIFMIQDLYEHNLNRIRQNKIWSKDPHDEGMLLFKARTPSKHLALMDVLQLEDDLKQRIQTIWDMNLVKTEVVVIIDLEQLSKTTTNVKAKLGEILAKYGVESGGGPMRAPGEVASNPAQGGEDQPPD